MLRLDSRGRCQPTVERGFLFLFRVNFPEDDEKSTFQASGFLCSFTCKRLHKELWWVTFNKCESICNIWKWTYLCYILIQGWWSMVQLSIIKVLTNRCERHSQNQLFKIQSWDKKSKIKVQIKLSFFIGSNSKPHSIARNSRSAKGHFKPLLIPTYLLTSSLGGIRATNMCNRPSISKPR